MVRRRSTLPAVAVAAFVLVACGSPSADSVGVGLESAPESSTSAPPIVGDDAGATTSTSASSTSLAPPRQTVPDRVAGDGAACFGTVVGLSCLGPDGWQNYDSSNSPLGGLVRAVFCPDGAVVAASSLGLAVLRDGNWSVLERDPSVRTGGALACASDGIVWVGGLDYLGYLADGEWTVFESSDVVGSDYVRDIAAAPDGSVWIVTNDSIARYDGRWQLWTAGSDYDDQTIVESIAVDDLGDGEYDVYVSAGQGKVTKLVDGRWDFEGVDGCCGRPLAVRNGTVLVGAEDGLVRIRDGVEATVDTAAGLSYSSVSSMAIDEASRQWIATSYGVTLFADGVARVFLVENSGLLDDEVLAVATLGSGPIVPAEDVKEAGWLAGVFLDRDGSPLREIEVVACVLERVQAGVDPCAESPMSVRGVTAADGSFVLGGLPAGRYSVAAESPDGWRYLRNEPRIEGGIGDLAVLPVISGQTLELPAANYTGEGIHSGWRP